ncbi:activin types I and II receptor domain protein [Ditylenchus destructor]|nr:activin types I and II receptor domain protein [Ditylenchus destructor]
MSSHLRFLFYVIPSPVLDQYLSAIPVSPRAKPLQMDNLIQQLVIARPMSQMRPKMWPRFFPDELIAVIQMNSFAPQPLPTLECCECSQPGGDFCPGDACLRTCTGNYCLVDFDSIEQGCGMGLPRLQNFLRIPNYLESLQGETTCSRYEASDSTSVHGCVCTRPNGMCNQLNKTRHYQLEHVVHRRVDNGNYCYSLHERGNKSFDEKVFRKSDSCLGHYCFVSVTTSELVIEVKNASAADQSLTVNALNVVSHAKVTPGCTIEYSSEGKVLSRHCICDSHMCNYFGLINGTDFTKSSTEEENAEHSAMEVFHDDTELGSGTIGLFCSLSKYISSLVVLLFLYTQFY